MNNIATNPLERHSDTPSPSQDEAVPLRYCLYARKSSEADEAQALSIESQTKEMLLLAQREQLNVVEIKRESHSAKSNGQRPVFNELIEDIKSEKFNAILAWHPDRLSRNAGDLGAIVDLIDQKKIIVVQTYSQKFTDNPSEKFLLMILGSQAKLENDNKSINVKRGLKARCEMGLWPTKAPIGYFNDKMRGQGCHIHIDPVRAPVVKQIFEKVAYEKWSGRRIHKWLKEEVKFKSVRGGDLNLSTIYTILNTPLYTGTFEYPRGSGKWYKGVHEPIIRPELFTMVQEKLAEERKEKKVFKEFTFVKLLTCGYCGSGITGQEKVKHLSNGTVKHYIYYSCTRHKDHHCKNPYTREEDLIVQLEEMINELDINEIGARHIIDHEIARYNKLRTSVFGIEKETPQKVDIRTYAKHLLKEGTIFEKRELLENLKNRLILKDRKIFLEN